MFLDQLKPVARYIILIIFWENVKRQELMKGMKTNVSQ